MTDYQIRLRNEPPPPGPIRYPVPFLFKQPGPHLVSVLPVPFTFDVWGIELSDDAWFIRLAIDEREWLDEPCPSARLRIPLLLDWEPRTFPLFTVRQGETLEFELDGFARTGAILIASPKKRRPQVGGNQGPSGSLLGESGKD